MRKLALAGFLILFATLSHDTRAATVTVNGVVGADGADGADGLGFLPPGGAGTAGGDADAQADGSDSTNTAIATGGAGGAGGDGGNSTGYGPGDLMSVGGFGGAGGAGGDALANAVASTASFSSNASAQAIGGTGGEGGIAGTGLDASGLDGSEGAGGNAVAHALATSSDTSNASDKSATAHSAALGGGAVFGTIRGAGGDALATAGAESLADSANATAVAHGGSSGCCTTDLGSPIEGLAGGDAEAHATAATEGSADANALAEAFGGGAAWSPGNPSTGPGGEAVATAAATSVSGNATATARETAGDGSAGSVGPLVSGPVFAGGAGASSTMLDAVSGGAGGVLTLLQEARGGDGGLTARGGDARSELLLAENLLGGELSATARAFGGSFQEDVYDLVSSPPFLVFSRGGDAGATVVATDSHGQRVDATAFAEAGRGNVSWQGIATQGGDALAHATARGLGEVLALADATTYSAPHANARSDAETLGPIVGAHSTLDLLATAAHPSIRYEYWKRQVGTEAGIGVATTIDSISQPSVGERHAAVFASPHAADVAAWSNGNPIAEAAIADAEVLALGSLTVLSEFDDDAHLTGSFAIDLDTESFAGSTALSIAFLDSIAFGKGIDLLHLRFEVDGEGVFDASFEDTASVVAGLDDVLVELGELGDSDAALRTLVLSLELDFLEVPMGGVFAFDFALLATGVPEPTAALLLACLGAVLLGVRRARGI